MIYDLLVIGGGINGAGIAADASGRGLSVLLAEAADLGGATSSASSKLIHGGLRYLEHYEFRLVREALEEREVLLRNAGHIIWPQRFILPQIEGGRSGLVLRAGLFLYDRLGHREQIAASSSMALRRDPAGYALRPELAKGFTYWDCRADDARLVLLNARAAAERGASIETRTRVQSARVEDGLWRAELHGAGGAREVSARVLVNAAGPWVADVDTIAQHARSTLPIRLVKGSHIVVPRIAGANDAYLCQNADGRVVFAIPYEERFTLVGTTDENFAGDPRDASISDDEVDYLLSLLRQFFVSTPSREDIVWSFAGVRPLFDADADERDSAVSRDYRLELNEANGAPLLTVLGGKLTTYRRLAEAAMKMLQPQFPNMGRAWTATTPLPGGDLGAGGLAGFVKRLCREHRGFDAAFLGRLARRYGTRVADVLGDAHEMSGLGLAFGAGLSEREVVYLREHEWAREPDDILWRRTKCGLHMSAGERAAACAAIAKLL
jgi:glycerol-3-phosphate dehydrogenase